MIPESHVVEMCEDQGLFQQGRIVDCAEDGLTIDWECEKPASLDFVPFGKIYLCKRRNLRLSRDEENAFITGHELAVEVLIRRSPKEPRTWYPGALLAGELDSVFTLDGRPDGAIVSVTFPDGMQVVAVPTDRIRKSRTESKLEKLLVQKGHFVKRRVRLQKKFCRGEVFAQQLVDALNRKRGGTIDRDRSRARIHAISIDGEWLKCIKIGYIDPSPKPNTLYEVLVEAEKFCDRRQWEKCQSERKLHVAQLSLELSLAEQPESDTVSTPNYRLQSLSSLILSYVFEQLDSAEQCRLRRVCAFWDHILTMSCVVRVRYEKAEQDFMSVASVHYGWTAQTTTIINAGVDTSSIVGYGMRMWNPLLCGGRLLRALVQKNLHAPVRTIVLADNVWSLEFGAHRRVSLALDHLVEELNNVAAVCQVVLLRNLKVELNSWQETGAWVSILAGRIAGTLTFKELWCRVENCLLPLTLDDTEMQQLSLWMDGVGQRPEHVTLLEVLNERQSNDPREEAHYRGHVWTAADLVAVDLQRLSKLTLHSFVAVTKKTSVRISLTW